jgi:DNA polymerase-1
MDVSGIAYRSMYAMGDLSFGGEDTGAIFGLFRYVAELKEIHQTDQIAFCFDRGYDDRLKIFSEYKGGRRDPTSDAVEILKDTRRSIRRQLYRLRTKHLPQIGFKNILCQDGLEADDLIASVCQCGLWSGESAVIVSDDSDLFQCLDNNVVMWRPAKRSVFTATMLREKFGVGPESWPVVKAIAGDNSDNIPGVPGVGIKTAVKFVTGTLPSHHSKFNTIVENTSLWKRNLELVKLPFPSTVPQMLQNDEADPADWNKVMDELGMKTLRNRASGTRK